eukprot:766192-Hanusia_phi.AAC.5
MISIGRLLKRSPMISRMGLPMLLRMHLIWPRRTRVKAPGSYLNHDAFAEAHSKEDAESAKKYLESHNAEVRASAEHRWSFVLTSNARQSSARFSERLLSPCHPTQLKYWLIMPAKQQDKLLLDRQPLAPVSQCVKCCHSDTEFIAGKGGKKDKKDDKPAAASSAPKQQVMLCSTLADTSLMETVGHEWTSCWSRREEVEGCSEGGRLGTRFWAGGLTDDTRLAGKKGVELAGCADMGGLEFFTTTIDSADGALELLVAAMDGANKEPDPNEEEAKGGSGMVGKMFLSSSDKQLALMCYVPESKTSKCNASEWMKAVLASVNGEFIEGNEKVAKGRSVGDGQNKFPLKDKDTCQGASVSWLKERGLFPQGDDEGDDWVPDEDAGIEW